MRENPNDPAPKDLPPSDIENHADIGPILFFLKTESDRHQSIAEFPGYLNSRFFIKKQIEFGN